MKNRVKVNTEVYTTDDDFNFILQAIKTRRNIKILKQDGYFERTVSLAVS